MKATNTVRFFEGLAQRMYHENDLSDMVYALCLSNAQFKQFFLDFFFKDQNLKAENTSIEREVSYPGGSRPDFVIRAADGKTYFVEVKIWDRSHHFAQYSKTLKDLNGEDEPRRLGYITNYGICKKELVKDDQQIFELLKETRVKQWSQFIKTLESSECNSWNNEEEVQGLIAYCNKVCPDNSDEPIEEYKYDANCFEMTKTFYNALKDFLNSAIDVNGHKIQLDKHRVANTPSEAMGFYFGAIDVAENLNNDARLFNGQKVWGWVGIRLKGKTGLCIAFDNLNGWGKPVFDYLNSSEQWMPFFFDLSGQNLNEVFCETFKAVFGAISKKETSSLLCAGIGDKIKNTPYYAVRKLPLFVRQQVIPKIQTKGYRTSQFFQKDSFNPSGWCGEYFSMTKIPSKDGEAEKEAGRFWVGTYYDGRTDEKNIVCEQIGGKVVPYKQENVDVESLCKFIMDFVKGVCN